MISFARQDGGGESAWAEDGLEAGAGWDDERRGLVVVSEGVGVWADLCTCQQTVGMYIEETERTFFAAFEK